MVKYSHSGKNLYYENSTIPINKLNIRQKEKIEEKERELLLNGYEYFHSNLTALTKFDETYFIQLHKKTFDKLYDFAGEYRIDDISKGGSVFCKAKFLYQESKRIFNELQADNYLRSYQNKPIKDFAEKLAHYMCEIIALHPFYELNGRINRLFFDMIVTYNGFEYINYQKALEITNGENQFITASKDCMLCNEKEMFEIILNGLTKSNQLQ